MDYRIERKFKGVWVVWEIDGPVRTAVATFTTLSDADDYCWRKYDGGVDWNTSEGKTNGR